MATQISNPKFHLDDKIPSTMRAVVYRGINDMRLEIVPVPEIGPGELLVKIATCGICGTDLKKIHTGSHSAPRIFGHEMAGIVVRSETAQFSVGERVMVYHHVPCGALLLLPQEYAGTMRALQESGQYGRIRAFGRWLCRVHSRDGLDCQRGRSGAHP